MNQPFLITGCGRSGTGWAAQFFTELGYPTGHEFLYNPVRSGPLIRNESSWLAVPFLDDIPESTKIVRMVRNPYDVVASVMARGFLNEPYGGYEHFAHRHRPETVKGSSHLERAIRWAGLWDEPVDDREHFTFHIDRYDHQDILNMLHYLEYTDTHAVNLPSLNRRINAGPPKTTWIYEILTHPVGHLVDHRAERFGYDHD